jgi:hypothetical protein
MYEFLSSVRLNKYQISNIKYIHHDYFAKIKADFCNVGHFINAMTIRYVGQNMLEW